jgi:hypothetical protein
MIVVFMAFFNEKAIKTYKCNRLLSLMGEAVRQDFAGPSE